MRSGFIFLVAFVLLTFMLICPQAGAVSLSLKLNTTEYINDLVFYSDGTHEYSKITGCLSIANPSLNDTVSDINIFLSNRTKPSVTHINELNPDSTVAITYEISDLESIVLPSVHETVNPSSLYQGVEQNVTFRAEITNPSNEDISILAFEKEFPEELKFVNCTCSAGSMSMKANSFKWKNFIVSPNSTESLKVIFKTTPCSDVVFVPSSFSFTTPSFAALKCLSFSAATKTSFAVEKQKVGDCEWNVGVMVEDASEFNYSLYRVEVYLSDTSLKETKLIKDYKMHVNLMPGKCWRNSFIYEYSGTPVFFAKIYYTIPYTITGSSMPIYAAGHGNFVVDSVVLEKESALSHNYDGQKLKIIKPVSLVSENGSVSNNSQYTHEKVNTQENISQRNLSQKSFSSEDKGRYFVPLFFIFLLALLGLIIWQISPLFRFFRKK